MKKTVSIILLMLVLFIVTSCVEVTLPEVESISVNWQPKNEYIIDEEVNLSSIILTVTYQDGEEETFTLADSDVDVDNIDLVGNEMHLFTDNNGAHTIVFSYENVTLTFEYTVFDAIADELGVLYSTGYVETDDLQDAVDNVPDNGWIRVKGGEYQGIDIDKRVTIIGSEDGTTTITSGVHSHADMTTGFMLSDGSDGSTIRNFTIFNSVSEDFFFGVFARGINNITLENLVMQSSVQGITNLGGSGWLITGNTIYDIEASSGGGIGIFILTIPYFPVASNNVIEDNVIYAFAHAEDYSTPGIALLLDMRNFKLSDLTGNESMENNSIVNNIVICSGVLYTVGIEIGSLFADSVPVQDRIDTAIDVISNTSVIGNTIENANMGLYLYTLTELSFQNNTIRNSDIGIAAYDGQDNHTISGNTFENIDTYYVYDESGNLDLPSIHDLNTYDPVSEIDGITIVPR
jgi:hypothetical protein